MPLPLLQLQFFDCIAITDDLSVVAQFPAIVCGSPEYNRVQGVMIALIVVVVGGGPCLVLGFLMYQKRKGSMHHPTSEARYGILYSVYKPKRFFWEAFILVRRVALIAINVGLSSRTSRPVVFSWLTL